MSRSPGTISLACDARPALPRVSVGTGAAVGVAGAAASGIATTGLAAAPWAASTVLHVTVLLALAAGVHGSLTVPPPPAIDLSFDESSPLGGCGINTGPFEAGLGGEASEAGSVRVASVSAATLLAPENFAAGLEDILPAARGNLAGGGDGEAGAGNGNGDGAGDGRGDGKVAFFGTEGAGQRFVFLIDCSTSMRGERFSRARVELIKTLLHLTEEQEFYIIFFSDRTFPLYAPHAASEPVKATKLQKSKARRWISNRAVVGNTVPDEALRMALSMKPDVIYFLSDGDFASSAREAAKDANTNQTVIHTIGFGYQAGETQLKAIAEDSKGRYRFVP